MVTTYKLDTRELEGTFIESIRTTYPNRIVEIQVREQSDIKPVDFGYDETEYLMSSPVNRKRLDEAIKNVEEGKLISFATVEEAQKCAEEWAAKQ